MTKEVFLTQSHRIVVSARSDVGKVRINNEDSYCVDNKLCVLSVADGLGGNVAGEVASKMAIDTMTAFIRDNIDKYRSAPHLLMKKSFEFANEKVYGISISTPQLRGMATTLTAGLIQNERLVIGHVGDSRAYLLRNGLLKLLTKDHTVASQMGFMNLSNPEIMRHVLTRAIGIDKYIMVDVIETTLKDGDVLLFCSDGLYSMIDEKAILSTLVSHNDVEVLCGILVDLANINGGDDNITVICAHINSL